MADQTPPPDGAAALRSLASARGRRPPLEARHPRSGPVPGLPEPDEDAPTAAAGPEGAGPPPDAPEAVGAPPPATTPPVPQRAAARQDRPRLPADAPQINLGLRVRQPVDDRFSLVVARLREHHGLRATKTEVLEMLLWDLPADEAGLGALAEQVRAFRAEHPRR